MKTQFASASKTIHAPASIIYNIIADFHNEHLHILPKPPFQNLEVEAGGFGAGTITRFQMKLLGHTQAFRTLITEPEPGRVLVETDLHSGAVTTFDLSPVENGSYTRVKISTELKNRGMVESFIGKLMLQKVYRAELDLLAGRAEGQAALVVTGRVLS
jgi:hypothetical protein